MRLALHMVISMSCQHESKWPCRRISLITFCFRCVISCVLFLFSVSLGFPNFYFSITTNSNNRSSRLTTGTRWPLA